LVPNLDKIDKMSLTSLLASAPTNDRELRDACLKYVASFREIVISPVTSSAAKDFGQPIVLPSMAAPAAVPSPAPAPVAKKAKNKLRNFQDWCTIRGLQNYEEMLIEAKDGQRRKRARGFFQLYRNEAGKYFINDTLLCPGSTMSSSPSSAVEKYTNMLKQKDGITTGSKNEGWPFVYMKNAAGEFKRIDDDAAFGLSWDPKTGTLSRL
jgi:hypothetical protein